jgi:DNA-binding transcriptional LysR family regulator
MELRHLTVFVAVAEEGSFTRASARLHLVQSAVSAGVRTLERELGTALFDRTTHRVQLTDAGKVLLPEARGTLAAARAAREAVDQVRGGLRGTVSLGIMHAPALGAFNVPQMLATFRAEHAQVELHVRQGASADMAADVSGGRLDFAVLALAGRRAPGVTLTPLARETMQLAVHDAHPFAQHRDVELAALADEPFADHPLGFGTRDAVERALAAAGLQRAIALEVNDTDTLIEFVRHGLAAAFLPPSFIHDRRGITLVSLRHHAPVFQTYIAEPATRRPTAAAGALLELAKRHTDVSRAPAAKGV